VVKRLAAVWLWLGALAASAGPLPPSISASPEGMASELAKAERLLRSDGVAPAVLAEEGHRQQRIYRALIYDPTLASQVSAHIPDDVRTVFDTNLHATRRIAATVSRARRTVPAWRIAPAAAPDELLGLYKAAEAEFGVPWHVLAAIHLVETRMGRLRGTSPAGARGPMQFIPETWARFGEGDIESNLDAIRAAARHLVAHGAPGNLRKALWHYNPTDAYGDAVLGYSRLMAEDPRAFYGYYHWQVYYKTIRGVLWLPEGYAETAPVAVDTWCARPEATCGEASPG
jgi:membrane-bound lytic murein transglycosylase B